MREFRFHDPQSGAAITVKVTPNAKRNAVTGVMGDGTVKIALTANPVEGAANEALRQFLADRLGLPKSQIDLVAGHTATRKLISIVGLHPTQVEAKLKPDERAKAKTKANKGKKRATTKKKKASKR